MLNSDATTNQSTGQSSSWPAIMAAATGIPLAIWLARGVPSERRAMIMRVLDEMRGKAPEALQPYEKLNARIRVPERGYGDVFGQTSYHAPDPSGKGRISDINLHPDLFGERKDILTPVLLHEMAHPEVGTYSPFGLKASAHEALRSLPSTDVEDINNLYSGQKDRMLEYVTSMLERQRAARMGFEGYSWPER